MDDKNPNPVIVVIVVWIVVIAVHGTGIILIVIERPAPQHRSRQPDDLSSHTYHNPLCFIHPPKSRPISSIILLTCSY